MYLRYTARFGMVVSLTLYDEDGKGLAEGLIYRVKRFA